MPRIHIDDKEFDVRPGRNLLETCLSLGFDLPYFCWHPALGSVGACRQCAVKAFANADDKKGKLVMACMETVSDGQRISMRDPQAVEFRENVIGWLMTNHPHDCAVCDEGGSCHLQDMTVMTGHAYREFRFNKRTYRNQYLGPFLNHEMNRCIQCYRCVRFYKDYAGGHDFDAFASANRVYFGRSNDGVLENEFSGNLAEVCPTGVFTDKTLKQHYTRKWDLTSAPSVCVHCSVGCNTIAGERYGSLRLISNRYNGSVNGYFLCDRGRFGYEFVNAPTRIREPRLPGNAEGESWEERVHKAIEAFRGTRIVGIGSPRASLEANFVLSRIAGRGNFYHGVSALEFELSKTAAQILSRGTVPSRSLKDVEKSDVVLIWGEDVTNTAPMLALSIRQALRNRPMEKSMAANIPPWNDAATREYVQDERGPLLIGAYGTTRLDEVASMTFRGSPATLARVGFAVANQLDDAAPLVGSLDDEERAVAAEIVRILRGARRPVIISGVSCGSVEVIQAAANMAEALRRHNSETGIVLTFPACNSLGLALMEGKSFVEILQDEPDRRGTLIILENDVYRHADPQTAQRVMRSFDNVIVIDHTWHETSRNAQVVLSTGTFAESEGTFVNNEGRAQRFFQVYEPENGIRESWRWLLTLGNALGVSQQGPWNSHDEIVRALAASAHVFEPVTRVAPSANYRINGQRIPRQPHRYSGRTAMYANRSVSEGKPPEDRDAPLSYTMEGTRLPPPPAAIPFFWWPGWNSVQAVTKYQEEAGGPLRGGDPGIRLLEPLGKAPLYYSAPTHEESEIIVVPLYHIFGSEELSALGPAIAERCPEPYLAAGPMTFGVHTADPGARIRIQIHGRMLTLPLVVDRAMPKGVAGLPVGLPGMEYFELPASANVIMQLQNTE
jgi:NADH-quinone oxidoreductase subunit G